MNAGPLTVIQAVQVQVASLTELGREHTVAIGVLSDDGLSS